MPPHFRVKELRHFPRYPTQVEAYTVFHRRQIQFFGHGVYMHFWREIVKRFFLKTFSSARVVGKNHVRPAFLFHERFDRETVK